MERAMIAVESYIRADVKVLRGDKMPLDLGAHRFRVLPRVGELVHLHVGETPYSVIVETIEHYAYTEDNTPTLWDTVVKLMCKAD